ncbi:MAG: electron transport complex subunit RsxA [Clostridia bacterium]|nr:electron transport complex subunit RsxA [Clostridia bacterium]
MGKIFVIVVSAVLVNNIVLSQFLGICPLLGVSKKLSPAFGMSAAVGFVMVLASAMSWIVQNWILVPMGIEYLQTIAFILVIASLVQFVEMVVRKMSPALYKALGVYLPLITTNCAVLGTAITNINADYNLLEAVINGAANAAGFALALILFSGLRERLDEVTVPASLAGTPIALVTAGIMAMAFLGFSGLL